QLAAAGLRVVAVGLGTSPDKISEGNRTPPFVVRVSFETGSALALFRAAEDGGETELLLDCAGKIRARWTSDMPGGLAPTELPNEAAKRERASCSVIDAEERGSGAAEDRDLVVVAEARGRQDMVDRDAVPRERVVGADHHFVGTAFGDQVTQPLGREHDRVE